MSGQGHKMFHAWIVRHDSIMRKMTAHSPSCTLISPHLHIINFSTVPFLLHIFIFDFIIPPPNQLTGVQINQSAKCRQHHNQGQRSCTEKKWKEAGLSVRKDGWREGWMVRGREERNGFCRWWKLMKLMKITVIYQPVDYRSKNSTEQISTRWIQNQQKILKTHNRTKMTPEGKINLQVCFRTNVVKT